MPLTQNQIEKLKSIPNRIKIFGEATQEQETLIQNRINPGSTFFSRDISNFLKDNYEKFKDVPLSVFYNGLLKSTLDPQYGGSPVNQDFLRAIGDFGKISNNRIIAGFVTSGTGVLTDRYALDTEVCFIEDETGGIGVVFQNSLDRGFLGTNLSYSFGDSTVRPLILNADGSSTNVLQNDYRHNLRVGDLLIIQSGEIMFGAGYGYVTSPDPANTMRTISRRYSNQGPMIIHKVTDYSIDTEFRGKSSLPFGLSTREEKLFMNRFGNQSITSGVSRFGNQLYDWKKEIYDTRLVILKGRWQIIDVDGETRGGSYALKGPLVGKNLVFKPNSIYYLQSEDGSKVIKICISATTEIAKFAVKLPSSASRPSAIGGGVGGGAYLEDVTGILLQDTESDERVLFPRFFQDLYYDIQE